MSTAEQDAYPPIPQRRPLAALAAAIEQTVRVTHMSEPNGHHYGYPRGTSICRTCFIPEPVDTPRIPEPWPCPTVREIRRLVRAVK